MDRVLTKSQDTTILLTKFWKAPDDTDANSTNCLLNSYANVLHIEQFGYHPYAFELANLVREGVMTRSEGLERLNNEDNSATIAFVKERLS